MHPVKYAAYADIEERAGIIQNGYTYVDGNRMNRDVDKLVNVAKEGKRIYKKLCAYAEKRSVTG